MWAAIRPRLVDFTELASMGICRGGERFLALKLSTQNEKAKMARLTTYVVQSFIPGRGLSLKAEKPISCKSAEEARRKAERMAPAKVGVVAFSTSGDSELGEYDDEPVYIFKAGRLPVQFEE
jgi:hypothetical protein